MSFPVFHIAGFGQRIHNFPALCDKHRPSKGIGVKRHLRIRLSLIGNERHLEFFGLLDEFLLF